MVKLLVSTKDKAKADVSSVPTQGRTKPKLRPQLDNSEVLQQQKSKCPTSAQSVQTKPLKVYVPRPNKKSQTPIQTLENQVSIRSDDVTLRTKGAVAPTPTETRIASNGAGSSYPAGREVMASTGVGTETRNEESTKKETGDKNGAKTKPLKVYVQRAAEAPIAEEPIAKNKRSQTPIQNVKKATSSKSPVSISDEEVIAPTGGDIEMRNEESMKKEAGDKYDARTKPLKVYVPRVKGASALARHSSGVPRSPSKKPPGPSLLKSAAKGDRKDAHTPDLLSIESIDNSVEVFLPLGHPRSPATVGSEAPAKRKSALEAPSTRRNLGYTKPLEKSSSTRAQSPAPSKAPVVLTGVKASPLSVTVDTTKTHTPRGSVPVNRKPSLAPSRHSSGLPRSPSKKAPGPSPLKSAVVGDRKGAHTPDLLSVESIDDSVEVSFPLGHPRSPPTFGSEAPAKRKSALEAPSTRRNLGYTKPPDKSSSTRAQSPAPSKAPVVPAGAKASPFSATVDTIETHTTPIRASSLRQAASKETNSLTDDGEICHVRVTLGNLSGFFARRNPHSFSTHPGDRDNSSVVGYAEMVPRAGQVDASISPADSIPIMPQTGDGGSSFRVLWSRRKDHEHRLYFSVPLERRGGKFKHESIICVGVKRGEQKIPLGLVSFLLDGNTLEGKKFDLTVQPIEPRFRKGFFRARELDFSKHSFGDDGIIYGLSDTGLLRARIDVEKGVYEPSGSLLWGHRFKNEDSDADSIGIYMDANFVGNFMKEVSSLLGDRSKNQEPDADSLGSFVGASLPASLPGRSLSTKSGLDSSSRGSTASPGSSLSTKSGLDSSSRGGTAPSNAAAMQMPPRMSPKKNRPLSTREDTVTSYATIRTEGVTENRDDSFGDLRILGSPTEGCDEVSRSDPGASKVDGNDAMQRDELSAFHTAESDGGVEGENRRHTPVADDDSEGTESTSGRFDNNNVKKAAQKPDFALTLRRIQESVTVRGGLEAVGSLAVGILYDDEDSCGSMTDDTRLGSYDSSDGTETSGSFCDESSSNSQLPWV